MEARSLGPDELIASYYTLAGRDMAVPPFDARVRAAAASGYAGIGMMASDYDELRAGGRSDADLRAVVDDHGICVAEVEFLSGWWLTGDDAAPARKLEETLLHMVDVFGARHVCCAAGSNPGPDIDQMAAALAALADRAAAHGAKVGVEFVGIATIDDLAKARALVTAADRPNAGVVIDAYHFFRSASTFDDVRALGPDRVTAIQLSDADGSTGSWSIEETRTARKVPGTGDFDLAGLLRTFAEIGVRTPTSVEILSPTFWQESVDARAERSYEGARRLLDVARSSRDRT